MTISGYFKTIDNEHTITVTITSPANGSNIVIGNDETAEVWFSPSPVALSVDTESTFDVILGQRATINLVTNIWLGDYLFADQITSIPVTIVVDAGTNAEYTIFDGYVENNTYNQAYAHPWEEISINCVDHLLAISYQKPTDSTNYNTLRENATIHTLRSLLESILGTQANVYFDGSKRVYSDEQTLNYYIFNHLKLSDNAWLGEDIDDLMSDNDILTQILQYTNLHIIQAPEYRSNQTKNYAFYIFDWDFLLRRRPNNNNVFRYNITASTSGDTNTNAVGFRIPTVNLVGDDYLGDDTNITVGEVYNKITVQASPEPIDEIISNPLETDQLTPAYGQYNRYMTEFIVPQEKTGKKDPWVKFYSMTQGAIPNWEVGDGFFRHWYINYMYNPQWTMNSYNVDTSTWQPLNESTNIYADGSATAHDMQTELTNKTNQWAPIKAAFYKGYTTYSINENTKTYMTGTPIYDITYPSGVYNYRNGLRFHTADCLPMASVRKGNCIGATIMNLYSTDKINARDGSTPNKVANKSTSLYITTNNICSPSVIDAMKANNHALCEYLTTTAASFIPSNTNSTYYLAFTGSITLSPFILGKYDYSRLKTEGRPHNEHNVASNLHFGGKKGALVSRVFYNQSTNIMDLGDEYNQTNWVEPTGVMSSDMLNITPYVEDDGIKRWQYYGFNNVDAIQKVGVLECSLRIGDKYLNEEVSDPVTIDDETYYYPSGTYEWTSDSTATFTIGFDPKLDDYLVGQKYEIGAVVPQSYNIEDVTTAMVIPITRSDMLSGDVEFKILAPMKMVWDDNHHRHRTWFKRAKDWTNVITVLNNPQLEVCAQIGHPELDCYTKMDQAVENIIISELKCTLYTDNGGNSVLNDNDIIYMSDEQDTYVESRDDIEFKFISGLTPDEAATFGVADEACTNFVLDYNNKPNIYLNTNIQYQDSHGLVTKPEKLYCTQYYMEYMEPKITIETTLRHTFDRMMFKLYKTSYFSGRTFYPIGYDMDLKYNTVTMKLKEC